MCFVHELLEGSLTRGAGYLDAGCNVISTPSSAVLKGPSTQARCTAAPKYVDRKRIENERCTTPKAPCRH